MAFENYAKLAKFSLISRKSDSISSTAVLLRKVSKNLSPYNQAVVEVKFGKYDEWVEELKRKFTEYKERPRNENIWLWANDSNLNGLIGLVNCLRQEPGGDRFRCIFSDGKLEMPVDFNKEPYNRLLRNDLVINIFRDNRWGSYRLLNLERNYDKIETTEAYLDIVKKGDLSSLKWFDLSTLENICEEEVNVKIYYSGIDFKDIAIASGISQIE
jgi:fatty acid synthase